MHEPTALQARFEERLMDAYGRMVAEAPTDVDVEALLRNTRGMAHPGRTGPIVGRRSVLAVAVLIAALIAALVMTSLVPGQRPWVPRTYADEFVPTGSMSTPRFGHSATLLRDGRVLVAGGAPDPGADGLTSAETYDPASRAFTPTGDLVMARVEHSAMLLPDGRVLLIGGTLLGPWAETYDPRTGSFTPSWGDGGRWPGTATLLPDGRVLLAGGVAAGTRGQFGVSPYGPVTDGRPTVARLAGAALYDPTTDSLIEVPGMEPIWSDGWAVLLGDGRAMVFGVSDDGSLIQIFEPDTGLFVSLASAAPFAPNPGDTMTLLRDGTVLFTDKGGRGSPTGYILDPAAGWGSSASMSSDFYGIEPALLHDGRVLFAGGSTPEPPDDAMLGDVNVGSELYVPESHSFELGPALNVPRAGAAATVLEDGRVLVTGGADPMDPRASVAELFD